MTYTIEFDKKNGVQNIAIVKIPKEDLDRKALYTIKNEDGDYPDFVFPFTYIERNGEIEFKYDMSQFLKLEICAGPLNDYVDFWTGLVQPLIKCKDWFMNYFCFAFDYNYIYCDKSRKKFRFIYIPSLKSNLNYDELKKTLETIAKSNKVSDDTLGLAIRDNIDEFNAKKFLQFISNYNRPTSQHTPQSVVQPTPVQVTPQPVQQPVQQPTSHPKPKITPIPSSTSVQSEGLGEFDINFGGTKNPKPQKASKVSKPEKAPKPKKESKTSLLSSLFTPKKKPVATEPKPPVSVVNNNNISEYSPDVLEETPTGLLNDNGLEETPTGLLTETQRTPYLKLIRTGQKMDITSPTFKIGRAKNEVNFCVPDNGNISRLHANIITKGENYYIIDLDSTYGTKVNDVKIIPLSEHPIKPGDKIFLANEEFEFNS